MPIHLRNRLVLDPSEAEMDRQDDAHSTDAQWGTPLATSQSSIESSSIATGSQQERAESPRRQRHGSSDHTYVATNRPDMPPPSHEGEGSGPSRPPTESIRRFSADESPWSPASGPVDRKRRISDVAGMGDFQLDRDYPDKFEEELEKIKHGEESEAEDSSERGLGKKVKRARRGTKRRGDGSKHKGKDKKDDEGANGGGSMAVA